MSQPKYFKNLKELSKKIKRSKRNFSKRSEWYKDRYIGLITKQIKRKHNK